MTFCIVSFQLLSSTPDYVNVFRSGSSQRSTLVFEAHRSRSLPIEDTCGEKEKVKVAVLKDKMNEHLRTNEKQNETNCEELE